MSMTRNPSDIQFGLMMRAQFPQGDDMQLRFRELAEQARLANALGYASITKGMHYSSAPWESFQQMPFLSRIMAEAPDLRINFGLVLLSLHKPLDIAEQIATADAMSGGEGRFPGRLAPPAGGVSPCAAAPKAGARRAAG